MSDVPFKEIFSGEERKRSIVEAFSYEEDIQEAGIERGLEQGILGAIDLLKSMGMELPLIKQKIRAQYHLTKEEAVRYMNLVG